jgi:hypothetical protein
MPERGSKTSTVSVVWANFGIFPRDPNDLVPGAIGDDGRNLVISLWPGDRAKQQTMEWRHSGSPRPKKFRVQKSPGKFLASIFWIKTASSSLIIFQRVKLSTRSFIHLCWGYWRTFRKNVTRRSSKRSKWFFFFFSGLQKLEQRAKKFIELREEYVE